MGGRAPALIGWSVTLAQRRSARQPPIGRATSSVFGQGCAPSASGVPCFGAPSPAP